ncbi:DUF1080 domain-containing protein [Membranihabitans marinus]|uniref:DUF1080 domain-containing protein n=1 Tax=Membranihabitans marinus TaxID=1227546 RepID=UPI001F3D051A|nr:family 16 glycoside hydrolase [Membranihabitans marinus]
MKKLNILLLAFLLGFGGLVHGQDQRSFETKVADVLNVLPANDITSLSKSTQDLVNLGPDVVGELIELYKTVDADQRPKLEYAFSALGKYLSKSSAEIRSQFASPFIEEILKNEDEDLSRTLLEELSLFIGKDQVGQLAELLGDQKLQMPVLDIFEKFPSIENGSLIADNMSKYGNRSKFKAYKLLANPAYGQTQLVLNSRYASSYNNLGKLVMVGMAETGDEEYYSYFEDQAKSLSDEFTADAILKYSEKLAMVGQEKQAVLLLEEMYNSEENNDRNKALALKGLIQLAPTNLTAILKSALATTSQEIGVAAAHGLDLVDEATLSAVAPTLMSAPSMAKANGIRILSRRNYSGTANLAASLLKDSDAQVRGEAVIAYAIAKGKSGQKEILDFIQSNEDPHAVKSGVTALKMVTDQTNIDAVASQLNSLNSEQQTLVIPVIGMRGDQRYFDQILSIAKSQTGELQGSALKALGDLGEDTEVTPFLDLIGQLEEENLVIAQSSLDKILKNSSSKRWQGNLLTALSQTDNIKYIPFLTYLETPEALSMSKKILAGSDHKSKKVLLEKLNQWPQAELIEPIADIIDGFQFRETAFKTLMNTINGSDIADERKLLLLQKYYETIAIIDAEKAAIINAIGQYKSFYTLLILEKYFEDPSAVVQNAVAKSVMKVVMPDAQNEGGMMDSLAIKLLEKAKSVISGDESSYSAENIAVYLASLSKEEVPEYESMFNGKDLTGWQGFIANPKALKSLSGAELERKTKEANDLMNKHWWVEDGTIRFKGKGQNLVSVKNYGNFEMIVDWKIGYKGDSGIYLRGTPQVQIWDISRVDVGAQVGSGGLYNNKVHKSTPSKVADMPVGEWNHMKIRMTGEIVSVWLNGELVVDQVVMENYWDRDMAIFPTGPIELQAHGTDIGFRNIYVKEIPSGDDLLTDEEKASGFKPLFNGYNLDGWVGNKEQYKAVDGMLTVDPKASGNSGNLYTEKEFRDFHMKFDFLLTPGANNGLGVHAPLTGDAAYQGKELQILDNTAGIYANLQPYQYHGSLYGIAPAKRGFLKPVGEWNSEEVIIKGDQYKVILNGETILDVNIKKATKKGTLDGKKHPGLKRKKGHIGFLGHGSEVKFKNLRIKEL